MHIVHIISAYGPGHVGNQIHGELGRAIIARGHRYSVLTLASTDASRGLHIWNDRGVLVYEAGRGKGWAARLEGIVSEKLFHYQPFLFAFRSFGIVLRTLLDDADLILVEGGYPLGAIAALWQPFVRAPLAVVLQGGDMHREDEAHYGFGRYAIARRLLRLTLRRASFLRTYSALARDAAIERGAEPSHIAVVAQNISDICYLPDPGDSETFRLNARQMVIDRHGLNARHLLVAVGRLLPIKGFDGLIRVLPHIEELVGERVELVICGHNRPVPTIGDYQQHLETLAAEIGVADRIRFAGGLEHHDVRTYLAAANLLVVPSVMEGGAKVVMEAAAVGTPFVATETAGTPAFLPRAGFIVPPLRQCMTTFPRAVAVLLRNGGLRRELGRRALEEAPRFTAESRAEELLPYYHRAAATK